jgi:hypothetical protein
MAVSVKRYGSFASVATPITSLFDFSFDYPENVQALSFRM